MADVLTRFYSAFSERDAETMAACYADDASFSDPVFPDLDADGVRGMWRMLCARGKDLELTFSDIEYTDPDARNGPATAKWVAEYTFSLTGKHVTNRISAEFELRDGLIAKHVDSFDFDAWCKQALGFPAKVAGAIGLLGVLRDKVRSGAAQDLAAWMKKHG